MPENTNNQTLTVVIGVCAAFWALLVAFAFWVLNSIKKDIDTLFERFRELENEHHENHKRKKK